MKKVKFNDYCYSVFSMILFCSCAQNNDVMASVNGIDIKKSDYEVRLKSNEIMAEIMTEDINNSDFTSEEKKKYQDNGDKRKSAQQIKKQ